MSSDIFGRRVHDDVRAVIERPEKVGRTEGVVDDERNAVLLGDARHLLEIDDVNVGIADGFNKNSPRVVVDDLTEIFGIDRIDEMGVHAVFGQCVPEQVETPAVQRFGRDDLMAGMRDVQE